MGLIKLTTTGGAAIHIAHDAIAAVSAVGKETWVATHLQGGLEYSVRESAETVVALIAAEREAERRARGTRFARLTEVCGRTVALNPAKVEAVLPGKSGAKPSGAQVWMAGADVERGPVRVATDYDETLRLLEEAAGGEGR